MNLGGIFLQLILLPAHTFLCQFIISLYARYLVKSQGDWSNQRLWRDVLLLLPLHERLLCSGLRLGRLELLRPERLAIDPELVDLLFNLIEN